MPAVGTLLFIAATLLAARWRALYYDAILSTACWVLGSVAAWRGVA